jgi:protein phosphatase
MENNFKIAAASVSDRGLSEKRPENEDSFLVLEERGLFAVADGVGGAQAGDVASQMAVEILGEAFINQSANLDAEDVMRAAIDRANSAIYQMSTDLPQLSSMATTLVALHLDGNIATIGHVGDSRAYRLDHAGNLRRETHDHSVVEEEVRAGRMTPEQAQNHPSKNIISRALGAEADVEIDLKTIMVEPGTSFLLCSDGITRHIDDNEIGGFLAAQSDPAEICERMKELCYERGAEDNLTAVIVRVLGEPAAQFTAAAAAGDGEELTVASSRATSDANFTDDDGDGDFSTSDTIQIDDLDDQAYLMEDADEDLAPAKTSDLSEYTSSSVVVPAQQAPSPAPTTPAPVAPLPRPQPTTYAEAPAPSGGSNLLSSILFLVLGALLGAAAYYFLVGQQPAEPVVQAPAITEMKSNNAPLTAFEESRRMVDKDPQGYLNAKAVTPREVGDFFLLGRAQMLTGRYWEAKRSFIEARNRLSTADTNDAKTLATEISMALAIIESQEATETFSRDLQTANTAAANANTNTATNSSTNTATAPVR